MRSLRVLVRFIGPYSGCMRDFHVWPSVVKMEYGMVVVARVSEDGVDLRRLS